MKCYQRRDAATLVDPSVRRPLNDCWFNRVNRWSTVYALK